MPAAGLGACCAGNVHWEPTDGETRGTEDHEEDNNERTTTDTELGDSDCCSDGGDSHRDCLNPITEPVGRDPVLAHWIREGRESGRKHVENDECQQT